MTLNEAYQFAFAETVARTESTVGGAQHPAYNLQLAGTGDVVMTDLRATNASLIVDKAVRGRLFIRDSGGALVIEINKTSPHPVELGLSSGAYAITLKRDGKLYRARVKLTANRKSTLALSAFDRRPLEKATARGSEAPGTTNGDEVRDEAVRVSFLPTLGGGGRGNVRLSLSLNILAGRGDSLRGLEVGALVNYMDDDVEGVQLAGLVNGVGGSSRGVRLAGLVNYTGGDHRGVILGGLFNASLGGGEGFAAAGLANYRGGDFRGLQLGGLANYVGGDLRGLQLGGLVNVSTGHLEGTQISGIANYAAAVEGAQIGLINAAAGRVSGWQLGLINVAKESDASIGLLNFVGNGYRTAEAWASDTTALSLGVKLGARSTYTILAVGGDQDKFQLGAGLGLHRDIGEAYYLDLDVTAYSLFNHRFGNLEVDLMTKLRLAVGFELSQQLAVFAGPTATGVLYLDSKDKPLDVSRIGGRDFETKNGVFTLAPGLFAGVRLML